MIINMIINMILFTLFYFKTQRLSLHQQSQPDKEEWKKISIAKTWIVIGFDLITLFNFHLKSSNIESITKMFPS